MSLFSNLLDISRSWGSSDEADGREQTQRHADVVNKRCIKEYGWTLDFTQRVLRGYQQFLELKSSMEDLDGDHIIPSPSVNLYWRQHILHTKAYEEDCKTMWGRLLHYNPDAADPRASHYHKRLKNTMISLQARYGKHELDTEVWDFVQVTHVQEPTGIEHTLSMRSGIMPSMSMRSTRQSDASIMRSPRSMRDTLDVSPREPAEQEKSPPMSGPLTITVRDQRGDEASFKVKTSTKLEKLMKAYAKLKGTSVGALHFTTRNGREVFSNDSCDRIGMKDGDILFVA